MGRTRLIIAVMLLILSLLLGACNEQPADNSGSESETQTSAKDRFIAFLGLSAEADDFLSLLPEQALQSIESITGAGISIDVDKLAVQAVSALEEVLDKLENGSLILDKQDEKAATYCGKISGEMAEIDWNMSAEEIFNRIRAFNPSPIASTTLNGVNFKIYLSEVIGGSGGAPGEIVRCDKNAVVVGCGVGCLRLVSMQLSGGKVLGYRDFVNGRKIKMAH